MIERPDMSNLKIPKHFEKLAEQVKDPDVGFFGPDRMYWRVSRERSLLLGGASAALLQLAHPMVGAGVAKFSDFDTDPIGRFHRTFQVVYGITFGSAEHAVRSAAVAWHIHSQISGEIVEDTGPYKKGDTYNATEADLLLWVYATLVQQGLEVYETFVAPLSDAEKAEYYADSRIFAQLFGIPEGKIPPDLPSFYAYFDDVVENVLGVAETGMRLRRTLLTGLPQYWVAAPVNFVLAGAFLPPKTREQFELPWNEGMRQCFKGIRGSVHRTLPWMPHKLRFVPEYLQALRRIEAAKQGKAA